MVTRTPSRLRGYSLPLSPSGQSSIVPPPPWHFAGDCVWVDYRADVASVAAFLPEGLEVDGGAAGLGFYDWQWCSDDGRELREPATAQFKECLVAAACRLGDEPVARVPYAWVDSAVPLLRGFIQGMPKAFGAIAMTRSFSVGRAAPRRAVGGTFAATLSVAGRRVATVTVVLERQVDAAPALALRPLVHTRHLPAWHPGDEPLEELVRSSTSNLEVADVWQGSATVEFDALGDEDLVSLAPIELGHGYVFSYAETLMPGRRVEAG